MLTEKDFYDYFAEETISIGFVSTHKPEEPQLLGSINETESEEFHKNLLADFLKHSYYSPQHFINTKGRNDLVIHNSKESRDSVGVILEVKKPSNKSEMLRRDKLNWECSLQVLPEE